MSFPDESIRNVGEPDFRKPFPPLPRNIRHRGLSKGDLIEVERELGVEVNGDLRKVEIKDRILQNDNNDIETIKAEMEF
ncbi:hypothetical protein TNCV_3267081 [Trichonephila clavipes]|nr:hypothetical protein TNCV_3267081 [Trichonephila clavipes]